MYLRCLTLLMLLPGTSPAQDARAVLRTAEARSWHVRVLMSADTVTGVVQLVTADSVTIGTARVAVDSIFRVDRRLWARDGFSWQTIWTASRAPAHALRAPPVRDTVRVRGPVFIPYLGTMIFLTPALYLNLPPPLLAGVQIGQRTARGEIVANLRGTLYYGYLLYGADVGYNALSDGRSYAGVAAGALSGGDGFFLTGGVRTGWRPRRGGTARFELRGDFVIDPDPVILLSLSVGADSF